jgi:ribose transport system substrate-binding protein
MLFSIRLAKGKTMRIFSLLAACVLATSMVAGCGDSGNQTPTAAGGAGGASGAGGAKLRIALIPKGTNSEYWKAVHAGGAKAAAEIGNLDPIWRGSLREDQSQEESNVVEDMINQQVDAIVLAPNNADALVRVVDHAAAKKIPVVIIDSAVNTKTFKSYVATDNTKGGYMGGQELAKELGNKGKVLMLRYQEGSASTGEREQGFLNAMKEAGAGIQIVDDSKYGGVTDDACYKAAENLLAPYKNADGTLSIDGIFCPNQTTTFGMLRALEDIKAARKVKFVGFDASEKLVQALKDKEIQALVVQDPINMGYLGVKTAVDIVKGKEVPAVVDTGVHLVTSDNINTPESQEILNPPVSKYLKE